MYSLENVIYTGISKFAFVLLLPGIWIKYEYKYKTEVFIIL